MGAGETQSSGAYKWSFQYLIPVYQLLVYPMICQLWQFTSTLTSIIIFGSHMQSVTNMLTMWNPPKRAKKVASDSPGLVDFAIRLVILFFTCPMGKFWKFFFGGGEIQITEGL